MLGRAALRQLRPGQVLVRRWPGCGHLPGQWFRVMDPDVALVAGPCGHFYEADEFDMVRDRGGVCMERGGGHAVHDIRVEVGEGKG